MNGKQNKQISPARGLLGLLLLVLLVMSGHVISSDGSKSEIIEVDMYWDIVNNTYDGYELSAFYQDSDFTYLMKYNISNVLPFGGDFYLLLKCDRPDNILRPEGDKNNRYYRIIDSGFTYVPLKLCASNAVMYYRKDSVYSHLICAISDSNPTIDTIISLKNNNADNILSDMELEIDHMFFLNDSLLITKKREYGKSNQFLFYRIGPDNSYQCIKKINTFGELSYCDDFSQAYITKSKSNHWRPFNKIIIYDLETETTEEVGDQDIDYAYYNPRRTSRDDYLYFIKEMNNEKEIWRIDNNKKQELIYVPTSEGENIIGFDISYGLITIYFQPNTEDDIGKSFKQISIPQ
ncbi:MAG: hypothetical protein KAR42_00600 [candidate division Zixibacteria bacterium]|nr:hypothetical protein [candidate division Zixibacteria bacterium]